MKETRRQNDGRIRHTIHGGLWTIPPPAGCSIKLDGFWNGNFDLRFSSLQKITLTSCFVVFCGKFWFLPPSGLAVKDCKHVLRGAMTQPMFIQKKTANMFFIAILFVTCCFAACRVSLVLCFISFFYLKRVTREREVVKANTMKYKHVSLVGRDRREERGENRWYVSSQLQHELLKTCKTEMWSKY